MVFVSPPHLSLSLSTGIFGNLSVYFDEYQRELTTERVVVAFWHLLQFDFISYAQYTTISREIVQDPPYVFVEKQPVEVAEGQPQTFVDVVIRRDTSLTNKLLPVEHWKRVGRRVLNYLEERFDATPSAIPKYDDDDRPTADQLLLALQQLVALFVLNGYAFDGTAYRIDSSTTKPSQIQFCFTLTSPATLWGGQALLQERSVVTNNFL